jgi:hypothetical protein
VDRIRR